jgi:hypothetical protein
MKTSIAFTLIIVATIFSFVSGYSIGSHSDQAAGYNMTRQAGDSGGSIATARAAENPPEAAAPTGGYGGQGGASTAASPGYGTPAPEKTEASPGYGAPAPAPGYGK